MGGHRNGSQLTEGIRSVGPRDSLLAVCGEGVGDFGKCELQIEGMLQVGGDTRATKMRGGGRCRGEGAVDLNHGHGVSSELLNPLFCSRMRTNYSDKKIKDH